MKREEFDGNCQTDSNWTVVSNIENAKIWICVFVREVGLNRLPSKFCQEASKTKAIYDSLVLELLYGNNMTPKKT